jgi:hypothetical protein
MRRASLSHFASVRSAPFALCGLLLACVRHDPPQWDAGNASLAVAPLPSVFASAVVRADAGTGDGDGGAGEVDSPDAASGDAGALPQTNDRPEPSGAAFDARALGLWDAIVKDDPALGMPFFFPLAAYEQVKAIQHPARDWKLRLVAAYVRDIHDLHARLGTGAAHAKLTRVEVPMARARWVEPGEEYNKIGYYRVFGTRLRGEADGHTVTVDVASLISWRGEWYCVHLSGVK